MYRARWELEDVTGPVVVIDVIRAFTTAAYALGAGAREILLVAEVAEALELARSIPGSLVMGELKGRRPEGFDLSNSPVQAWNADVDGRVIVQRTSAGTQGAVAARHASHLMAASLVCASATAAMSNQCDDAPTYVITGRFPDAPDSGDDDLLTAQHIERLRLGDHSVDPATVGSAVAATSEAAKTLALGGGDVHPDDIAFATDVDRFDFAMVADLDDGLIRLHAVRP